MITVKIQVNNHSESLLVAVRARSIEQAIRHAEEQYAECDVRVVFPLDPDSFFAGDTHTEASAKASDGLKTR